MTDGTTPESLGRAVAIITLLLDARAAEAASLLSEHGVPTILLKGRAIASWLYADAPRHYGDIDLLVDPGQRELAIEILGRLTYRHHLAGADLSEYGTNETDLISESGIPIDLHHTLLGVSSSPERCWQVLSEHTDVMMVGGRPLRVLDEDARTMHLALHVAQNGPADTKAVADLERGLAQLSLVRWEQARNIAKALDADQAFSAGLQVSAAGREMACTLGLEPPRDVELLLRTRSAPAEALQIQRFLELRTLSGRLHLVGRKLWPSTPYMLGRIPAARGGPAALLVARLRRMAGLPPKFRIAFHSWSAARRAAQRPSDTYLFDSAKESLQ